jgi:hypothetical protein
MIASLMRASEFRDLLAESGFVVRRVIQTACPYSLIEAVPW